MSKKRRIWIAKRPFFLYSTILEQECVDLLPWVPKISKRTRYSSYLEKQQNIPHVPCIISIIISTYSWKLFCILFNKSSRKLDSRISLFLFLNTDIIFHVYKIFPKFGGKTFVYFNASSTRYQSLNKTPIYRIQAIAFYKNYAQHSCPESWRAKLSLISEIVLKKVFFQFG